MKLKVCGLSNSIGIKTCVRYSVNFCGFILNYSKSHRFISFEKAKKLLDIDKNQTDFVGVLVNPTLEELEKFSKLNLDYFQLYGQYDNRSLINIKNRFKKKIIITIQVKNKDDIENVDMDVFWKICTQANLRVLEWGEPDWPVCHGSV